MDPELAGIFTFVFLMAILAVTTAMLIHRRFVSHEERKLELQARLEEAKAAQAVTGSSVNRKLEERVRVLERIALDRGTDLAREIEDLRTQADTEEAIQ